MVRANGNEGAFRLIAHSGNSSIVANHSLEFEPCKSAPLGEEAIFQTADYSTTAGVGGAVFTIVLWAMLRCLHLLREAYMLKLDAVFLAWPVTPWKKAR